jgi:hypothetical protein
LSFATGALGAWTSENKSWGATGAIPSRFFSRFATSPELRHSATKKAGRFTALAIAVDLFIWT